MAIVASASFASPTANAFYPNFHDTVTRAALPPDLVDNAAMVEILGNASVGAGAVGSDVFLTDAFRHFDSAATPADICIRATDAWNFFTPLVMNGAVETGPDGTELIDGPGARSAFGGLLHAVQDFYAHSNWVELNVAANNPEALVGGLFPGCDPAALPADLSTGFFALQDGTDGCPDGGPPPGFAFCHEEINKDGFTTPEGGKLLPEGVVVTDVPLVNYFDLASLLAARASTDTYWQVRTLVVDTVNGRGGNGECVANNVFFADLHEECL
ncbi:MAG: hypothetical protein ACSLE6_08455 [Mycobacterium sp.]